jgi:RNA polymerase sigma-70 factor, ECF subfamily
MTATLELTDTCDPSATANLVLAAQAGDRYAFGELAERFGGMVYSIASRRLNNDAEAQELTQEVLLRAMQRLSQLDEPAAFPGWLRTMTDRMAINRATRRQVAVSLEPQSLDGNPGEGPSPLDSLLAAERARVVHSGLAQLGDLDRRTLEAFYLRGESLGEMSVTFAAPVGTIKRRLHVARKRLAAELEMLQAV